MRVAITTHLRGALAGVNRWRYLQPVDYSSSRLGSPVLAGVLAGTASVADPFAAFSDERLMGWPTAGFERDLHAIGGDFWRAVADYTFADDEMAGIDRQQERLFDPDAVGA